MMNEETNVEAILADIVDGVLAGDTWQAWLAARPDVATELELARRARAVLVALAAETITVPADFEARLRQRLREDATLQALLDLGLLNLGRALLELVVLLLSLLPSAPPSPHPQPAG